MKLHGWLGLLLLIISEYGLVREIEPFVTWFYCFAWWSYILLADSLLLKFRGRSLFFGRRSELLSMLPLSVFIWLIFEAFNFRIQNWSYSVAPMEMWQRWIGYLVSYATVLPAIFITAELVQLFRKIPSDFDASGCNSLPSPGKLRHSFIWIILGLGLTAAPLIWPRYFFPAVWLGPIFLLNPFLGKLGIQGLSLKRGSGFRGRVWSLMLGGFLCGILWEFWNFWAGSKWVYTVPFLGQWKIFEMPAMGFLGFPPFALECWILYHLLSTVPQRMHSFVYRTLWWLWIGVLSFVILCGIDTYTVI